MNPPTLHQEFLNTVAAIPPAPEEPVPDRSPRNSLAGIGNLAKRLRDQLKAADMSELNFAKTFLTTLDAKNTKYTSDHVFDPKTFATRVPFTLPKLSSPPHPPPPRTSSAPAAPGSTSATPTATILLKSTRNPALSLLLPDLTVSTTIASLKESVQVALGGASVVSIDKIKILYNKKPIPASKKTIADVVDDGTKKEIELGVMVMGGAPDQVMTPAEAALSIDSASAAKAPESVEVNSTPMEGVESVTSPPISMAAEGSGPSAGQMLQQEEFWDDLQGFLEQRLKDEGEAGRLRKLFEGAWNASG